MTKVLKSDTFIGPSFSFLNRFCRAFWSLIYIIFFRFSPVPMHRWRAFLLRLFGAKLGRNVHIYPNVKIWAPWNLICGNEVGIGGGAIIYNQDVIRLGLRAVISQGVHLCSGTHDYNDPGHPLVTKPILIGSHVWIAADAFVHPGIVIEDGAVIGARSVVTKNMPAWTVCAGHPCKPIKPRVRFIG